MCHARRRGVDVRDRRRERREVTSATRPARYWPSHAPRRAPRGRPAGPRTGPRPASRRVAASGHRRPGRVWGGHPQQLEPAATASVWPGPAAGAGCERGVVPQHGRPGLPKVGARKASPAARCRNSRSNGDGQGRCRVDGEAARGLWSIIACSPKTVLRCLIRELHDVRHCNLEKSNRLVADLLDRTRTRVLPTHGGERGYTENGPRVAPASGAGRPVRPAHVDDRPADTGR